MRKLFFITILAFCISNNAGAQIALSEGGSRLTLSNGAKGMTPQHVQFLNNWKKMDDAPSAMVRIGNDALTVVRTHSQADLQKYINGVCAQLSGSLGGQKCLVVGTKKPKKRVPASGGISINRQVSEYFLTTYKQKQKPGKFGALAISANGGWGAAYGFAKEQQAHRRALRECKKVNTLGAGKADVLKVVLMGVSKKLKMDKCSIVHVHKP